MTEEKLRVFMKKLTSSVIIPTRNRLSDIKSCLNSLAQQSLQPDEIIIVDNSDEVLTSNDSFNNIFNSKVFSKTTLIFCHTLIRGASHQRNRGIKLSNSDIFHFIDDDTILSKDYLKNMVDAFTLYPEYAGGMGTIFNIGPKKYDVDRLIRTVFFLQKDYSSGYPQISGLPTHAYGKKIFKDVRVLGGCCMAYRACVLKDYMFCENLGPYAYMEDFDLSYTVSRKFKLFFNPKAHLIHNNSPSARENEVVNRARYMRNYFYLFFKNFFPYAPYKILFFLWAIIGLYVQALWHFKFDWVHGYTKGIAFFLWEILTTKKFETTLFRVFL